MSTGTTAQKLEPRPSGLVWIDCPYPIATLGLSETLKADFQVHCTGQPPAGSVPTVAIISPERAEDLAREVDRLRSLVPSVPIVVLCLRPDMSIIRTAVRAGARGFIYLDTQPAQIIHTLSLVSRGGTVVPNEILEDLVGVEARPILDDLSPRQREILELAAEGLTNAQIGQRLYLSEITIKQHLRAAYKLLKVRNRVEAVMLLKESG